MNVRFKELDNFFNAYKDIILSTNIPITADSIYAELANYSYNNSILSQLGYFKSNDKIVDIESKWQGWIDYFKNYNGMHCFHTSSQPAFLQFHNNPSNNGHVKMYLNVNAKYIDEAVKRIFGYIGYNDMGCLSKVARSTRSDDIVVRLNNVEDAYKFLMWVNNDKFLLSICKPTNPFMMRCGVVGIGYDDRLSMNNTLAMFLANYFNSDVIRNNPSKASVEDFRNYLIYTYNNVFVNKKSLKSFINYPNVQNEINRVNDESAVLLDYEDITKTLIDGLDKNKTYRDTLENISTFQNPVRRINKQNSFRNYSASMLNIKVINILSYEIMDKYGYDSLKNFLMSYINGNKPVIDVAHYNEFASYRIFPNDLGNAIINVDLFTNNIYHSLVNSKINMYNGDTNRILKDLSNYHDFNSFVEILNSYMNGNINCITRRGGFRGVMQYVLPPKKLYEITNGNVEKYLKENIINYDDSKSINLLDGYIHLAYKKYGYEGTIKQLQAYVDGCINSITRDKNYRELFVKFLSPKDIIYITQNDLSNYVDKVLTKTYSINNKIV